MPDTLRDLLAHRKSSSARGIYSICSAHPWVLAAAMQQAIADDSPLLIEATSNQVNQFGGYTGMRPADFHAMVMQIADREGMPRERIILGGDHLGPNPWQKLPAAEAMKHAIAMVAEYARAGFTKLHLDASMSCADDPTPIAVETVAERAAQLCEAAEKAAGERRDPLSYVIGTEVPVPGGATESLDHIAVTKRADAEETLITHREIFAAHGLEAAWPRVIALVVQPGVEFNHDSVVLYEPSKAQDLIKLLDAHTPLVFEAHSSDYQLPQNYVDLVRDGFAILKVGPALTFALREALFGLAAIEDELVPAQDRSNLIRVVEDTMLREPKNWKGHYHGTEEEQRLLRRYSYSDRMRYYWPEPQVKAAVDTLMDNLSQRTIPETMLSAYLPDAYRAVRAGSIPNEPLWIVLNAVREAIRPYAAACFQ
ncbi:MAG: D-tagatose-bisphosphate aldolase, class II, non-catalytic subunit [Acidobacteria bacterium]|nr:D-tagatose-bisphosphate aldolase, class II, non-catalytic subunit [Acidobacteriota bacterium]